MSKELNKALELLREIRPSIPKDVLELWCADRDDFLASQQGKQCSTTQLVGDLLAVIHRDGGHYQDEHGIAKALIDAKEVVNQDRIDLSEWQHAAETAHAGAKKLADYAVQLESKAASKHPEQAEGATPVEAVIALMSAERIDPEQESVEQAGGDERAAFEAYRDRRNALLESEGHKPGSKWHVTNAHYPTWEASRAALAQPSPAQAEGFTHFPELLESVQQMDAMLKAEVERPEVVGSAWRNIYNNGFDHVAPFPPAPGGPVVDEPLMTVAQHSASVARWAEMFNRVEQQRDAALAEVERLRQFERICEGLPQDAIDGGWTVQGIRCYAKRLEDQLKSALARVAALTATRNRYGLDAHYFNKNLQRILRDFESFTPDELARSLIILAKVADEKVVAQAQHSVPELDQLYSMLGAESQVDAAKKIAELIGCRMSRSALTEAQMRRIYENSTEIENERLGFAAFARLMRRAEAVHQIAAAPGKEGV